MSSMTYCMFENLSNDIAEIIAEIIAEYEEGTWRDGISERELRHVKRLRIQMETFNEILNELSEEEELDDGN